MEKIGKALGGTGVLDQGALSPAIFSFLTELATFT
jgi:hypothetical protein